MATKRTEEESNGASEDQSLDAKKPKSDIPSGILLFTGATDWDDVGRKTNNLPRSNNTFYSPLRLAALKDVQIEAVSSGPGAAHQFAITSEGKVYAWGRNENGQLGLEDLKDRKCPTLISELDGYRVVTASVGRKHSLFLTDKGQVFACGDNSSRQCGVKGKNTLKKPELIVYDGPPAVEIACGGDFSGLVDVSGGCWMFGSPNQGQCGNNTDGKYIEKAGKESFDLVETPLKITLFVEKDSKSKAITPIRNVVIKHISCGQNHTVVIDDRYRAFSWGFGGYGRLGHSETGNEMVPRLIKFLDGPKRGIRKIVAGGQFNLAVSEMPGTVYMWGQYVSNKEANMYPKPIHDLSGWAIRSIACNNKSWMIAADESVIGCCPSPCYGELGMGDMKKSSANPVEVTKLDGVHILACGMGISHSVFIARNETEEDKKAIEKFKILDQSDQDK